MILCHDKYIIIVTKKQPRQLIGAKARLGQQMDSLDIMDKFYEKKEFLNSFVELVDIYEQEQSDGRFLKHIKFRFPVYFGDREQRNMKVLLGTTNPSKVKRFSNLLKGCDIEFITLKDIEITDEPKEDGVTPEENAISKAKFYGQYYDTVICNDSGLYFEELALDDTRQPGLNIRTPMNMKRLSDDEMIEYYSKLISELGGKVSAYYLDGIAVYNKGKIFSFMDPEAAQKTGVFC